MNHNDIVVRRDGWITARIDDDLVMMHAESDLYLSLSGSAGRIWELIESPRTVTDLCQALCREFEIEPDAALPEVAAFLDQMLLRRAIDVHPSVLA